MKGILKTACVLMLVIPGGTMDLEFYKNAFSTIEMKHLTYIGSIHVSEMEKESALFHCYEEHADSTTIDSWKFDNVVRFL